MRILLVLLLSVYSFQSLSGQTKERDSVLKVLNNYALQRDNTNLLKVSKQEQNQVKLNTDADSLYLANLIFQESRTIKSSRVKGAKHKIHDRIIDLCPNNHDGLLFKAFIIKKSATFDIFNGIDILAYKKMEKALAILEGLNEPYPVEMALQLYTYTASHALDYGETEKYNRYYFKAHQILNQKVIKPLLKLEFYINVIGFNNGKNIDEEKILYYINEIKTLGQESSDELFKFKYAKSQVNVSEFYLGQVKKGDLTAVKKAYKFVDKVLSNKNNDRIMLYYKKKAWYVKNDLLIEENKFESALKSNTELINFCQPQEARMSRNLYQRIKILLKLNRLEEAQQELFNMVNQFHIGSEKLKSNYSNFKSNAKLEYVSLFLDLSDAFKKFETKDVKIKNAIVSLNKLGLYQFQNAIDNKLTTSKTRTLLKRIIFNFIETKDYGLGYGMTTSKFLETIENLKNTLDWQEFLQNRAHAKLPFINDFKYQEVALRQQLVQARKTKQDSKIVNLELQLDLLEKTFKETYPNYSKLAFSDFNIADFQSKMKADEVVLRYETIKDSLYTFVISKNEVRLLNIGHSETISTSVKSYVSNISERINTDELSKQLYERLIPKDALSFNQINIVPDDYLFKLPFETLKNDTGNYLIEDKVILYAPYLSLFQHNTITNTNNSQQDIANLMIFTPTYNGVSNTNTDLAVRGNEYRLIGAEKESQLLADVFGSSSFSNYSATKENFKEHAPNAQLLHLSMHADIDPETPELSYLLFTKDDLDNKLYIEELYGMNLKADMAVLSACNTGNVLNTDKNKGIVSLHRAFTQAGVPTTVASLWSAPDNATQKIMVEFYKQLKDGKTKAKALQLAKLNYLKTTDDALLKAPFYWAGFVINGNNAAVITTKPSVMIWVLVALAVVVLIGFFLKKWLSKKPTLNLF